MGEIYLERDNVITPVCNICGGDHFKDAGKRKLVRCVRCGSKERTRLIKMHMDRLGLPRPGQTMLHLAPELGLYNVFKRILGDGYTAADYVPESCRNMDVRKIDLVKDAETLPSQKYDIILHSHVVEHIPCNITAVLFHLHRALKPGGYHVMCVPLLRQSYAENIGVLTKEEAVRDFGQFDHVRRFSAKDLELTLGQIFKLPNLDEYDLEKSFGATILETNRIPREIWKGRKFNNIFLIKREDLKLVL